MPQQLDRAGKRELLLDDNRVPPGRRSRRNLVGAEEGAEDAVVDRDLVAAPDEGRATCPVEVVRGEQRRRPAEDGDPAGADRDTFASERPPEGGQRADGVSHGGAR